MSPSKAILALLALALICFNGCGKSGADSLAQPDQNQPASVSPPAGLGLPAPLQALAAAQRGTSAATPELPGADFEAGLPHQNVTVDGTTAIFDSAAHSGEQGLDAVAYAIYHLNVDGLIGAESLAVSASGPDQDSINLAWFGVANFATNRWEWKRFNVDPEGFGITSLLMLPERVDPDGDVMVAVVTPPSLPLTLKRLLYDTIDEVEDDDTSETACPLPGFNFDHFRGSLYVREGQPSFDGDREDWYSVDGPLQEGQKLQFEIVGALESTDFAIEVFDSTGDHMSGSDLGGYTDFEWKAGTGFTLDPAKLPLKIRMSCDEDEPGWSYPGGNYYMTMRAGFEPAADLQVSPRVSLDLPATVDFDASATTDGDNDIVRYDWYVHEIETVYDFEPEYFERFSTTGPTAQRTLTVPGLYECEVTVVDAAGFEASRYMKFQVGPSPYDELEDNDRQEDANPLLPAKAQSGMLGSLGELDEEFDPGEYAENDGDDDDYYQISVPDGQSIRFSVEDVNAVNAFFDVSAFVDDVLNTGFESYLGISAQELNDTGVAAPVYARVDIDYIEGTLPDYGDYRLTWVIGTAPDGTTFTATPGGPALTFDFAASATDSDGSIASWAWDFDNDDVEDAQGQNVSHTFPDSGVRYVRLMVTDDDGLLGQYGKNVNVN